MSGDTTGQCCRYSAGCESHGTIHDEYCGCVAVATILIVTFLIRNIQTTNTIPPITSTDRSSTRKNKDDDDDDDDTDEDDRTHPSTTVRHGSSSSSLFSYHHGWWRAPTTKHVPIDTWALMGMDSIGFSVVLLVPN